MRAEHARWAALCVLVLAIVTGYAFVVTAGTWSRWPTYVSYYDELADAFKRGHLYLSLGPDPQLLAAKDPLDAVNSARWRPDLSLHNGKYYLYWGPVPAVVLAIARALAPSRWTLSDPHLVLAFLSLSAISGTLILTRLARALFDRISFGLLAVSILAFALANPALHLAATAGTYQAAIAGGQAWLLTGLLFAVCAVSAEGAGRRLGGQLALAGACFACSLGCRLSSAPGVGLIALATVLFAGRSPERRWAVARNALWLGAPFVAGCAGLLVYNKVRFGGWLEFGLHEQLTHAPFRYEPLHYVANIYNYSLRPLVWSCTFPYGHQGNGLAGADLPRWMPSRGYISYEPVVGILIAVPLAWAVPVTLLTAARKAAGAIRVARQARLVSHGQRDRLYVFCSACFFVIATIGLGAPMGLYLATMRYLGDFSYGVVLLGILGIWTLYAGARATWAKAAIAIAGGALGIATVAFGLMLGWQGQGHHFATFNPELAAAVETKLSVCRK